ncbi:PREDICTED: uncharacterized protein LOC104592990 [Nelumbo nucifera]|nr:PREDICTED: uncharacterized protein LOC104592990 [Nelumbo nucifera]
MVLPSPYNPRPNSRIINKLESPPTAGIYTKVSSKPTNHSKFTGKCGRPKCDGCHIHPACKSRVKAKGTQKLRSCDVVTDHRLVAWRVVDNRGWELKCAGVSATEILNHLSNDLWDDDGEVEDYAGDVEEQQEIPMREIEEVNNGVEDDDDDCMSFCDVGFVLEQVEDGDEGWCLVGEI